VQKRKKVIFDEKLEVRKSTDFRMILSV